MSRRGLLVAVVAAWSLIFSACHSTEIQTRVATTVSTATLLFVDGSADTTVLMEVLRDELVFRGYQVVDRARFEAVTGAAGRRAASPQPGDASRVIEAAVVRLHKLQLGPRGDIDYVDIRLFSHPEDELVTSVRWRVRLGSYRDPAWVAQRLANAIDAHYRR